MKFALLAICLSMAGSALAAAPDEIAEKLLSTEPDKADMALVTPAVREGVIKQLGVAVEGVDEKRGKRALIYLLRLDDPLAVSTVMVMFNDFQKPMALGLHVIVYQGRQPLLIPEFAPSLYSEEVSKALLYDQVSSRKDENAAALILDTICESPAFSREMRIWAQDLEQTEPSEFLPEVRTWWELNKEALGKGEYGKARPARHGKLAAERTEAYRKLVSQSADEADLSVVPPEEKEGVTAALREDVEDGSEWRGEDRSAYAELFLVQFGDEKTIAHLDFESYPGGPKRSTGNPWFTMEYVVLSTKQPLLIPWIAPYLYSTKAPPRSSDVMFESQAGYNARLIGTIIQKSPVFTPELKEWLKGKSKYEMYDLDAIKALWEQNKDAFKAGKYGEVKPPKMGG